jgi:hypothetical protein
MGSMRESMGDFVGSLPSFSLVKGKGPQSIAWQQPAHPITCSMLGKRDRLCGLQSNLSCSEKTLVEANSSSIVLSPNVVLGCGKDGQLRLFRNYYEVKSPRLTFLIFGLF